MNKVALILSLTAIAGCVSKESDVRDAIRKDPSIIFNVIEENPDQFIASVNRAALKAQASQREKAEAEDSQRQQAELKKPLQPKNLKGRRLIGDDLGKIVIVEFADFQCPACAMAHKWVKEFVKSHKGDVQFYYKNMPLDFHKMAMPSARYFEAIRLQGQDKALKFHDYLFENQQRLTGEDFLKEAARQVGADMKRLSIDVKSEAVSKTIAQDMDDFQELGFNGTPVLIMNGVSMYGAQPLEELERMAIKTKQK